MKYNLLQSTTRITDFFVVGKMSGVLVGFVIPVSREAIKETLSGSGAAFVKRTGHFK